MSENPRDSRGFFSGIRSSPRVSLGAAPGTIENTADITKPVFNAILNCLNPIAKESL
jgi:hypothetical protein